MKKILISNRGEIAVRIIRACADYGVNSVAIYAASDLNSMHVRMADEAYALEGTTPADTYLNIPKIIAIAKRCGADAIHPGYGFLSENAQFAQAVIDAGLIWIGPSPQNIELLGNKVEARKIAKKVGAPLVKGTTEPVKDVAEVLSFAKQYGVPIAIKAAYGGGGRGLKVVHHMEEVAELFESATREAVTAFGNGECFLEQFLDKPRHVEVQVLADKYGTVQVLGTRDCSLQRRSQKLVEEAPAPFVTEEQQDLLHKAAQDICSEAGYIGAGTVEFMLSSNGTISFLEVNTRLQVEHTVTEETLGVDLVIEQFRIAEGLKLDKSHKYIPNCHAMEFRINAEDPGRGFIPTPGLIQKFTPSGGFGIRVDAGVESGSVISGTFDSMMAKLIVKGATRKEVIARAQRALNEFQIEGVPSTLPFFKVILKEPDFTAEDGNFKIHTQWIETDFVNTISSVPRSAHNPDEIVRRTVIEIDGKLHKLGLPFDLINTIGTSQGEGKGSAPKQTVSLDSVKAPISGTLEVWNVKDGDAVIEGDHIGMMGAMKTEIHINAHKSGKIKLQSNTGSFVDEGVEIAIIE